jgi:CheY-like chemotaxis protein
MYMTDNKQTNYLNTDQLEKKYGDANQNATQQPESDVLPWVIQFRVVGTPNILQVPIKEVITLGRSDPRQDIKVDIDLTRFDGQKKGVSRQHARMVARDNRITVTDLKSANGTFINEHVLEVQRPYRLRDGDRLRLGSLDMQVSFIVQPYTSDETMVGIGNNFDVPDAGKGQHILVLDTDQPTCDVIGTIIQQAGFTVSKAYSVTDAFTIIDSETPPDMLFSELLLQEGSGLDVIRYFRQKIGDKYPVVAMTSVKAGYHMEQSIEAGVDIFLAKPLAIDELGKTLKKVVAIVENMA